MRQNKPAVRKCRTSSSSENSLHKRLKLEHCILIPQPSRDGASIQPVCTSLMVTALICHDADWGEAKRYQEVEDIKHTPPKQVKSGNDSYSKSSFISYWVDRVVAESGQYFTIGETNLHKTQTILGCPNISSEFSSMPNANESEADQSFSLFTLKPNDTSYTVILKVYNMFCNEYYPSKKLLDKATAILCKNWPEHLDSGTAFKIQQKAFRLRKASEDMVAISIEINLFPFLFDPLKELSVSMNIEWTDALNISSP